ncbi:MAG: hypothetical protein DRJ38_10445 [Thermoprotei archaeon]|nr:MAG: hypothetical protein DRJ38_10445 [Thermoprotei archaeon]
MNSTSRSYFLFICVGTNPIAVASVIWAYHEILDLKGVYLFPSSSTLDVAEKLGEATRFLIEDSVVKIQTIDEANIKKSSTIITDALKEVKKLGYRVGVDVTAGRKTMSLALYRAGMSEKADLITYLYLKNSVYQDVLYPFVPKSQITLVVLHGEL